MSHPIIPPPAQSGNKLADNSARNPRGPRRSKHNKSLYTFAAPEGIAEALRPHLPMHKSRVWLAKCLYVASAITQCQHERSVGLTDWVPLYSAVLADIIGHDQRKRAIGVLKDAGVIEHNTSYRVTTAKKKGYSQHYRFAPAWGDAKVVQVRIDDPAITRNLARAADRDRKAIAGDDLLRPMAAALDHFSVVGGPEDRVELVNRRNRGFAHNLKRSGFGQRAYHQLTNYPRELRQFARVQGEAIWSADISCSQPLLYGLFLRMAQDGHVPEDLPDVLKQALPKLPRVDPDELDRYVRDIQQGKLYDVVVMSSGVPRLLVKLAWMRTVFGVPEETADAQGWVLEQARDPVAMAVGRTFRRLYPSVYGCLDELWRIFGRGGLPNMLQRFESWLFLDRLTARIHAERPDLVFSSVHDSLLGTRSTVKELVPVIEHEYRLLFGITPGVKQEEWSKPQAAKTTYEQTLFESAPAELQVECRQWLRKRLEGLKKKNSNTSEHRYLSTIKIMLSDPIQPYVAVIEGDSAVSPSATISCDAHINSTDLQCVLSPVFAISSDRKTLRRQVIQEFARRQGLAKPTQRLRRAVDRYDLDVLAAALDADPTVSVPYEAASGVRPSIRPDMAFEDPFRSDYCASAALSPPVSVSEPEPDIELPQAI